MTMFDWAIAYAVASALYSLRFALETLLYLPCISITASKQKSEKIMEVTLLCHYFRSRSAGRLICKLGTVRRQSSWCTQ